ncbi:hypothetical protein [Streptomyces sp. NPDC018693]
MVFAKDWAGTKLRWGLSADTTEKDTLVRLAAKCIDSALTYEPAP